MKGKSFFPRKKKSCPILHHTSMVLPTKIPKLNDNKTIDIVAKTL